MPIRCKSNISSFFRRTLTSDSPALYQIFPARPVILPSQVLGWLSIALFDQGFPERTSSAQQFRHLKYHVTRMPDHLGSNLEQLVSQRLQRPFLH
jgi:hypothetical protein